MITRIIKPHPTLKFIVSIKAPALLKKTVSGKHLMELESGEHGWFNDSDVVKIGTLPN